MQHRYGWLLGILLAACIPCRAATAQTYFSCATPTDNAVNQIVVGDLDRDSDLDLVTLNTSMDRVSVYLLSGASIRSRGCGGLPAPVTTDLRSITIAMPTPATPPTPSTTPNTSPTATPIHPMGAKAMALGDVDQNGTLDVAVALSSGVILLRGNGQGALVADTSYITAGPSPLSIAIADVDADGRADLVVGNASNGTVVVIYGPSFTESTTVSSGDSLASFVVVGDFNRDGALDFAAADSGSGRLTVFLQRRLSPRTFDRVANTIALGTTPSAVVLGDVDGDGVLDLVVGSGASSGRLDVFRGTGSGNREAFVLQSPAPVLTSSLRSPRVALGFLDSDARLDVVASSRESQGPLAVLYGSDGGLSEVSGLCGSAGRCLSGGAAESIATGDIDQDGRPDVIVGSPQQSLGLLLSAARPATPTATLPRTLTPTITPPPMLTPTPGGDCCTAHDGASCDGGFRDGCSTCVCDLLPSCCQGVWDARCAGLANGEEQSGCMPVCKCDVSLPTPTQTETPTPTGTPTLTPTQTLTTTPSITPTGPTATATPTVTITPTGATHTPTATLAPSRTRTATASPTVTATPTRTAEPVGTSTPRCIAKGVCVQGNSCAILPPGSSGSGLWLAPALVGLLWRGARRGWRRS